MRAFLFAQNPSCVIAFLPPHGSWLLLPLPAMATPCTSSSPTTAEIISQGLGAPSVPIERRRELTDKLLCSALAGNVESQEVAGLLYYAGPARHGNVLPAISPAPAVC